MRVVVTDYTFPALEAEAAAAAGAGAEFSAQQCKSADDVAEALRGADIAVVQFAPCTSAAVEALAPGAAIIRYGVGYDNVDVAAANRRGIPVGYVPDYCLDEVADHTTALILTQLRKLARLDASVRRGEWAAVRIAAPLPVCSETTVGFLGFGRDRPRGARSAWRRPASASSSPIRRSIRQRPRPWARRRAGRSACCPRRCLSLHAPATPQTVASSMPRGWRG